MYVALNGSAVVYHDNLNAALIGEWTEWNIDLEEFSNQGIVLTNVDSISIGFGDRNNPQPGGSGKMYFDDIRVGHPVPVPEQIENILANGGFEDGVIEPWGFWGDATAEVVTELVGAAVPEAPIEGDSCLHITVNSAGANDWDYGLNQGGHVFEAGKKYTVSAFLKCKEGALDIRLKPERGADPWEGYGEQVFTMTDQWAEYSVTTPVFTEDVSPASITFHIAFAAGDFWVDGVRFYEGDYVPPDGSPVQVEPGNKLVNGGFEDGVVEPWNTYGDVTTEVVQELVDAAVPEAPIEGDFCLYVLVPTAAENFWDAGLQPQGEVFEAGKKYTISAFLKSKEGTLDINFKPELGEDPWTGYGEQMITITDEWAEYSVTTPVFTEDVSPASFTFHIGSAVGGFWIDGVRFYEGDYVPPDF
jgi:hypothetical protein